MERKQGELSMTAAEGGGDLELTVHGNQVGLATMITAMKGKLKVYGIKDLDDRELTLTLEIRAKQEEEPQG